MIALDTDHISLLQWGGNEGDRVRSRLQALGLVQSPPTTIITYEEQVRGWMKRLRAARTLDEEIHLYAKLRAQLDYFSTLTILDFTAKAATEFQRLRGLKVRIGTMDLKITAIALANDLTLWTRNSGDFARVPGLRIEDAAKP